MDGMGIDPHISVASCAGDRCNGLVQNLSKMVGVHDAGLTKDEYL